MTEHLKRYSLQLEAEFKKITNFRTAIAFIRGPFTEAIQEACSLLPVNSELLEFFARVLFSVVLEARKLLDVFLTESERAEIIAAWHALCLADEALKPYAASFRYLFEDKFVAHLLNENGVDDNLLKLCPKSEKLTEKIKRF